MINKMNRQKAGMALLECAAVLFLFLLLFVSSLALLDYLRACWRIGEVVDRYAYDQAVKPFRMGDSGILKLDSQALKEVSSAVAEDAFAALTEENEGGLKKENLYIEAQFALMQIDRSNGRALSVKVLDEAVASAGKEQGEAGETGIGQGFSKEIDGAVPSSRAIRLPIGGEYLATSILFGVRAAYRLDEGLIGWAMRELQIVKEPVVSSIRITSLRGEVGL